MNEVLLQGARALAPESALALCAFCVLVARLVFGERAARSSPWIAQAGLLATALLLLARDGDSAAGLLGVLRIDGFAACFKLVMTLCTALAVLLWTRGSRAAVAASAEACFFLLSALLGAFLLVSSNHALVLILALELLSLASFALLSLAPQRRPARAVVLRFIVHSSLASAAAIFGVSVLFGLTGTLDFARMTVGDGALPQLFSDAPWPVAFGLTLVFAGFVAKLSLASLRVLDPEAIDVTPPGVAVFFALVARLAGFGALLRLLCMLFVQDGVAPGMLGPAADVGGVIAILAAVTMTLGNLAALRQSSLKRMLVCASVAQSGVALIGVATLSETGFGAALVCVAVSALTGAAGFAAAAHFEILVGSDRLADLRGAGRRSALGTLALIAALAGWIGLPPTVGFYAIVRVFLEAWNAGLAWLVVLAALNTLVAAGCLLRVAGALFAGAPAQASFARERVLAGVALALALAVLLFGVWTRPLDQWANAGLDLLRNLR